MSTSGQRERWLSRYSGLFAVPVFSMAGFLTMGYHPGAEDDGVYLTAVKAELSPALFPHDAAFFQLQMHASAIDNWMAHFIHVTGFSIEWSELLWQCVAIVLTLWACWRILSHLFQEVSARVAGIAALSAMFTLPVAGTSVYIFDQYLHPRNVATACILLAVERILAERTIYAAPLMAIALLLHPMMGAYGASFCFILALTTSEPMRRRTLVWVERVRNRKRLTPATVGALVPFGWVSKQPSRDWLEAVRTRHWFWIYQWTWYEWLGVLGPLFLLWIVVRTAIRRRDSALAWFGTAVLVYAVLQQSAALLLCSQQRMPALGTLEPMRYLHLVYTFLVLIGGALLGRHFLRTHILRWTVLLLLANGGMFLAQRQLFAASPHLELPGRAPENAWLEAFSWVRANTPTDAYFAVGAWYMTRPGDDMHNFRALAERSVLADALKDGSVVSKAPELAPIWRRQVDAQAGWEHFHLADFERLKTEFGVGWVLTDYAPPYGLSCVRQHRGLSVCRIP